MDIQASKDIYIYIYMYIIQYECDEKLHQDTTLLDYQSIPLHVEIIR